MLPKRGQRSVDRFVAEVLGLLLPLGPVRARAMFGGHGIYRDDRMFGLIASRQLYLKVDDETTARFAAARSAPFVYESANRRIAMSYWLAPDGALGSSAALLPWAELALAAAERAAKRKRRTRPGAAPQGVAGPRPRWRSRNPRSTG